MKKAFIYLFMIFCMLVHSQPTLYKTGSTGNDGGVKVAIDGWNNTFVCGYFTGTVNFPNSSSTYTLATATNSTDIFIYKKNYTTAMAWVRQISGIGIAVHAMVPDNSGNIIVSGTFEGTTDLDPGPAVYNLTANGSQKDIFILKLNSLGNFMWAKQFDGPGIEKSTCIKIDPTGNIIITGSFDGTVDFDPSSTTSSSLTSVGNDDIFISKLDATGNFVWIKQLGGSGNDKASAVIADASGNIFATGIISYTADLDPGPAVYTLTTQGPNFNSFISKLDASGNFVWAKQIESNSNNYSNDIVLNSQGNIITTGSFSGIADFDTGVSTNTFAATGPSDGYVLNLNSTGNFLSLYKFGGTGNNSGEAMVIDVSDVIYLVGYYSGTTSFFPPFSWATLTANAAATDLFIASIYSNSLTNIVNSFTGPGAKQCSSIAGGSGYVELVGAFSQALSCYNQLNCITISSGGSDMFFGSIIFYVVGVKENQKENIIHIYPKPASDFLNIDNSVSSEAFTLKITDLLGRTIIETELSKQINIKELKPGIYFLQVFDKEKLIANEKIIKE